MTDCVALVALATILGFNYQQGMYTISVSSRHSGKGGKVEFWECEGGTSALINVFFQIPGGALRIQGGQMPPPPP